MTGEKVAPRYGKVLLQFLKKWWPYIAGGAAAVSFAITLIVGVIQAARVRAFEARKPYLERQLSLNFELANLAGRLVSLEPASPEWKLAEARFNALRWSEMYLVSDGDGELEVAKFLQVLERYSRDQNGAHKQELQEASVNLAKTLRDRVDSEWSSEHFYTVFAPVPLNWDEPMPVDLDPSNMPKPPPLGWRPRPRQGQ